MATGDTPLDPKSHTPSSVRPKRVQCKNACTNCQKACKKCNDSRPCQRCVQNGWGDSCVDSKRKERKKGVKRGPYKKRDGNSFSAGVAENNGSKQATYGAYPSMPHLPCIGPVAYPPHIWGMYSPVGPGGKLEGVGCLQPVFAFAPVGSLPHHGEEVGSMNRRGEMPYLPIGFFPTNYISYPGPFQPYPIPQGHGNITPGFQFAYPPPAFFTTHHPTQIHAVTTSKDNGVVEGSGKGKEESFSQVNGQVKVTSLSAKKAAEKEADSPHV